MREDVTVPILDSEMSDLDRETYFDTDKIHIPEDREHPRFSFRKLWAFTGAWGLVTVLRNLSIRRVPTLDSHPFLDPYPSSTYF